MYKISEFAKLTGWTGKTLRYYDEIGLLKPNYVDNYSGYRYYTEEQLKDAKIIDLLKSCYFTLDEVKLYMNNMDQAVIDQKLNELMFLREDILQKIGVLSQLKQGVMHYEDKISDVKDRDDGVVNTKNYTSEFSKRLSPYKKAA